MPIVILEDLDPRHPTDASVRPYSMGTRTGLIHYGAPPRSSGGSLRFVALRMSLVGAPSLTRLGPGGLVWSSGRTIAAIPSVPGSIPVVATDLFLILVEVVP